MAIQRDLDVAPYFDDFDVTDNYYRVLFKPGVSVQVRELNNFQSIMQNQVEQMADNLYKNGTLISGSSFKFYPRYEYVKLLDNDVDGVAVNPTNFLIDPADLEPIDADQALDTPTGATNKNQYYIRDSANLQAIIIGAEAGFESRAPDLNTFFLRYINSGVNATKTQFDTDATLTVFDPDYPLESIAVINGGLSFSNNDTLQVIPSIQVNCTTGVFEANQIGTQIVQEFADATTANLEIVSVTALTGGSSTQKILRLKPINGDLSNTVLSDAKWTLDSTLSIRNTGNTIVADIEEVFGQSAKGVIVTDSAGTVTQIAMSDKGEGYEYLPYATIRSSTSVGITNLELTPKNFASKVIVASASQNAVGQGYAFGISEGSCYINGQFLEINPQTVVVSKYDRFPNNLVVGLESTETIVNSSIDSTLLDNAGGTLNYTAPGADRLKIEPVLTVYAADTIDAESEEDAFITLVEFDDGKPTKQFRRTQFSTIEDNIAVRHDDITGDYVTDEFALVSKDLTGVQNNTHVALNIDPGRAYINGRAVQTFYNTTVPVLRGTNTAVRTSVTGGFNYGNYVRVTKAAGELQLNSGDEIVLKSHTYGTDALKTIAYFDADGLGQTRANYAGDVTIPGTKTDANTVGTAKVRYISKPGSVTNSKNQEYYIYLYDININDGFTFRDVQGVAQYDVGDGTAGVFAADGILETDGTTGSNVLKLKDTGQFNKLVFDTGYQGLKHANNIDYTVQRSTANVVYNTNGAIIISLSGGETFPYSDGALTSAQLSDIIVTAESDIFGPDSNIANLDADTGGAVGGNTVPAIPSGWANSGFPGWDLANTTAVGYTIDDFVPGEWIEAANNANISNAGSYIRLPYTSTFGVTSTNRLVFQIDEDLAPEFKAGSITLSGQLDWYRHLIPGGYAISLAPEGRGAVVSGSGTTLTINAPLNPSSGQNAQAAATVRVQYPVRKNSTAPASKTVQRDLFVKIQCNTAVSNTTGPWCLGVPDGFRLKKVYRSTDIATVNTSSDDVTTSFFLDNGQRSNKYDLSYLVKSPKGRATLAVNDGLLVQFDAFTGHSVNDVYTIDSYPVNDVLPLANNIAAVNTLEIPEFYDPQTKQYYDLRDCVDFRPVTGNTATITQTAGSATINPSATGSLITGNKFYPKPADEYTYDTEYYLGHHDTIELNDKGNFNLLKGKDSDNEIVAPNQTEGTLKIANIIIPPYPSLPTQPNPQTVEYLDKRTGTGQQMFDIRSQLYKVSLPSTEVIRANQPRKFSMADINQLERRVKNLEYYTSISLLEQDILNTPITSSVSASINRFKNGFIIDDFDNENSAEVSHPEFSAEIVQETSELEADKDAVTINLRFNIYDDSTDEGLINKYGFRDDGRVLASKSWQANSESISYTAMLPFENFAAVQQAKKNGSTPKITPKLTFRGRMWATPATFDIGTRVRVYKRQS